MQEMEKITEKDYKANPLATEAELLEKTKLQEANATLKEQLATIGGLTNVYFAVYWIDLQKGVCKAVKSIPQFELATQGRRELSVVADAFVSFCVQPEHIEKMHDFVNWQLLPERMREVDTLVEEFHGTIEPWNYCRASWIAAERLATGELSKALFAVEEISASIAERRKREEEHKLLEEQYHVIEGLTKEYQTVWLITGNGAKTIKYQDTNAHDVAREAVSFFEQFLDYAEGIKNYCTYFVHPEDREEFTQKTDYAFILARLQRVRFHRFVYRRIYKGSTNYYQLSYTLADKTDTTNDIVMGFKDITDVVIAEHKRNEELTAALEAAEYANHAKTKFLNSMSHDIRTPMNAVIGFTHLAQAEFANLEKMGEYLKKIELSGEHLLSLINDVLDMSRIESGKLQLNEQTVQLKELLEEIRTIILPTVDAKQLRLVLNTQSVSDDYVLADKLRLKQILLNIMGNSVKFNKPKGLLSLTVKEEKNAPMGYARYHFIVRDTGIGMSKEFQKHIFESFTREETATVSGIQGTGLGMSITKKFVDMMGGTITVQSELGVGTVFDVWLSFRLSEKPADGARRSAVPAKELSLKSRKILLVEDNALNQEIATAILEQAGAEVELATNGAEAVAKMTASEPSSYDVILMDVQMPVLNGYEATKQIRALAAPHCRKIPIIALTANAFDEDRELAVQAGMNGYIAKPIQIEQLLKTIGSLL